MESALLTASLVDEEGVGLGGNHPHIDMRCMALMDMHVMMRPCLCCLATIPNCWCGRRGIVLYAVPQTSLLRERVLRLLERARALRQRLLANGCLMVHGRDFLYFLTFGEVLLARRLMSGCGM